MSRVTDLPFVRIRRASGIQAVGNHGYTETTYSEYVHGDWFDLVVATLETLLAASYEDGDTLIAARNQARALLTKVKP